MLKEKDFYELSEKQEKLDNFIKNKFKIGQTNKEWKEDMAKRTIAFVVELGEFANEEKSFKFWKENKTQDREKMLEEYVDGLFFLISIANELEYDYWKENELDNKAKEKIAKETIDKIYLNLFGWIGLFIHSYFFNLDVMLEYEDDSYMEHFQSLLDEFISLGVKIKFTREEVLEMYNKKLAVNYKRQTKDNKEYYKFIERVRLEEALFKKQKEEDFKRILKSVKENK